MAAIEEGGPVDILVNNAGNAGRATTMGMEDLARLVDTDPADWEGFIKVNLYGVMYAVRAALPGMIEADWGRIVTVISDTARVGETHMPAYSAAKAGAAGFCRSVAREVGRNNITVNCVALGTMNTQGIDPRGRRGRRAAGEEVRGQAPRAAERHRRAWCTFLASPQAEWITGQTYPGQRRLLVRPLTARLTAPGTIAVMEIAAAPVRSDLMETVDDVRAALAEHDYLADEGLATAIFLAMRLQRPLLLEGEAGVGKTEVAKVLARWTGGELVRLQCYEGIDAVPGRLRVGLLAPAAAPARGRGRAAARWSRTSSTPSGSS